ncbi:bifunctional folylpolyglutamate synthase/dihydrofolate synthase [Thermodesulfobacteriota bacterium]
MGNKSLSYKSALRYLYGLQKYGIKFGLNKTENLLKRLGNPHHDQSYIHIGGSNGKGSVAAILESVLIQSGLKIGFYSSPHLVRFTERFRINGHQIALNEAAALTVELMDAIDQDHPPTFFEVTTAMALTLFAREETDISIIEVGMGGRLDATNVIRPAVSVITNISLEHQFFLGSRLRDIAGEKAGIIKPGVPVVTAVSQRPVIRLFEEICDKNKSPLYRVGKDVRYRKDRSKFHYFGFNHKLKGLELNLRGKFQHRNAATALAAVEVLGDRGIKTSSSDIVEGLKRVQWPGRMQVISTVPQVILDGAHNPAATKKLAAAIAGDFSYRKLLLVIGVLEDKDISGIIKRIIPLADYVIYTRPDYYRSAPPEEVMRQAASFRKAGEIQPSVSKAIDRAKFLAGHEDIILVCGSLFTVGEALTYFDPGKYHPDVI